MKIPLPQIPWKWLRTAGLLAAIVLGFVFRERWLPQTQAWIQSTIAGRRTSSSMDDHGSHAPHEGEDSHAGHDHGAGDSDGNSLALSPQAMRNIGLTPEYLQPVELQTFQRTITVPAIVTERPGRTLIQVSTPMAGVITHVHAVQGEAVTPGTFLFELRITGEELVSTQTALLTTIGDLDVEEREIKRLTAATQSGAIAPKTLLERQYAKEKLEVLLAAQREALRLHGLSERQIDDIAQHRRLLRDLRIVAPGPDSHGVEELHLSGTDVVEAIITPVVYVDTSVDADDSTLTPAGGPSRANLEVPGNQDEIGGEAHPKQAGGPGSQPLLTLQELLVHKGETVDAGATLAVLSDYSSLYIEGRAFEQDATVLHESLARDWGMIAQFDTTGNRVETVANLKLSHTANRIDVGSRSLHFYVDLPNEIVRDNPSPNGQRYVTWKYRPGQRLQLRVPVEEWKNQIVLPVAAISREGAESYVFQQNGDHFDRISVHVLFRDSQHAVIANDGAVFPGYVIARRGAHQMTMAIKNQSGGGVDPHAGHNH